MPAEYRLVVVLDNVDVVHKLIFTFATLHQRPGAYSVG